MPRITISYRRDDSGVITGRIFDRLAGRYGRDAIFRDIDNIPLGVDFRHHVDKTIATSDIVIVIVGPQWIGPRQSRSRLADEADPVRVEVEATLRKGVRLVPVLVLDASMPRTRDLPESLQDFAYRHAVRIDAGQDFDVHMARLLQALDNILEEIGANKEPSPPQAPPPIAVEPPKPEPQRPAKFWGLWLALTASVVVALLAMAALFLPGSTGYLRGLWSPRPAAPPTVIASLPPSAPAQSAPPEATPAAPPTAVALLPLPAPAQPAPPEPVPATPPTAVASLPPPAPAQPAPPEPAPAAPPTSAFVVPPPTVAALPPPLPGPKPDIEGLVTRIASTSRFTIGDRWIDLWGVVDSSETQTHQLALKGYLMPTRGMVQCFGRPGGKYQCMAGGKDLAELALQAGLARPAADAPPEYKVLRK